jgi:hypothetical protein
MMDAATANENSIADTKFLLLTINGDRQDTLEPKRISSASRWKWGAGTRAREGTMNSNTVAPASLTTKRSSKCPICKISRPFASIDGSFSCKVTLQKDVK